MDTPHSQTTDQVYARYADMLFRLAFAQLNSSHDAEDAVAEVFVKYFTDPPAFRDSEHEKAWFIRVLINRCHDLQRRRSVRAYTPLEDVVHLEAEQRPAGDVLEAVMTLQEKYRTAILLHYFEGFSLEEIALAVNATVPAVKMRLKRGRTLLKPILKGANG